MLDTSQDSSQPTGVTSEPARIVFLHHSTGQTVWLGSTSEAGSKILGKSDVEKLDDRLQQDEQHSQRSRR